MSIIEWIVNLIKRLFKNSKKVSVDIHETVQKEDNNTPEITENKVNTDNNETITNNNEKITQKIEDTKEKNENTINTNKHEHMKGIFVRASDTGKLSFTELKQKKYNHIFLSHIIFDTRGEDYVKKFAAKCKIIGAKLIIFYTTYYNGDNMVNPTSSEANKRIEKIITIGEKEYIDGVCLDYNRHNSSNHNDTIMDRITSNTNKVVTALQNKEVYATCMAEHPDAVKNYYHQDIRNWKAIPLPMLYKYNYNYNDTKMKQMKELLCNANNNCIMIFQNYHGDNNITDIGIKQLESDIHAVCSDDFVIFRYGTGCI